MEIIFYFNPVDNFEVMGVNHHEEVTFGGEIHALDTSTRIV